MTPNSWWEDDAALRRFVCHLLAGELGKMWPGAPPLLPVAPWPDELELDERGLGIDSLDRLQLVASLADVLDFKLPRRQAARLAHNTFGAWLSACRHALGSQEAMSFRSSGSTGQARPSRHALAGLVEEAAFLATLFPRRLRVISAVPAHHIYGFLFSVLLPRALGGLPVEDVCNPTELAVLWRPGDLVIGFPDFWLAVARQGRAAPPDVLGTTSTAPCAAELSMAVGALDIELTEVFGSSETAGLGWRRDPDAPFRWFPWWHRKDGVVSRVCNGSDIQVLLPDRLTSVGPAFFYPEGRLDARIQVGGINVSPLEVRACLLEHPFVQDVTVRLMRPEEGSRLKAFIVPRQDAPPPDAWQEALSRWIEARLPPPQRPRALRFGPVLPLGAMGKAADWAA